MLDGFRIRFRVKKACIKLMFVVLCYLLYYTTKFSQKYPYSSTQVEKSLLRVNVVGSDDGSSGGTRTRLREISFLHDTQSCQVPKLNINNTEVISFFKAAKPLKCRWRKGFFRFLPFQTEIDSNWLFINNDGQFELIRSRKGAKCKVGYITRKNDTDNILQEIEEDVREGEQMRLDFAQATCRQGRQQWKGLLMSVAENKKVRTRIARRNITGTLSVYILGFDSLSQMSFRRNLPKSVRFLENDMEAVVLNGYNIVGDGTPQAFIPILTGQTETELPLTRKRFLKASYVDDVYPFVWKNFSDAGYVTLYGEDAHAFGTFTLRLKGFRKQPTDHFLPPFFKEHEKEPSDEWNCLGSSPLHQSWFRYSREFMQVYSDIPRFLLMHQSLLSHDDINQVQVEDDDLYNHLKMMQSTGAFENTLVIVMGDHGHRFAQLRNTHQGQLEERLPFFSLALPKKFRETEHGAKIYKNLRSNKDRLSSPFDIYATLLDVINPPSMRELTAIQETSKRSLSLFRPHPTNRSCSQADIAAHWCTCLNWQNAMITEEDMKTSRLLADVVVDTINDQLKNTSTLCAKLRLKELISSKKLTPNGSLLKYKSVKDADGFVPDLSGTTTTAFAHFQLKLSTTPGRAIYEITLFYDFHRKQVDIDLTSISHLTKYGSDPHCIIDTNYFLATFCVCHDRI